MGRLGNQKGAAFERNVCQRLSLWVSCSTREDCFWRSAMSGGRATLKSRKVPGKKIKAAFGAQSGDVTATHAMGNLLTELFVVECKHVATLNVDTLTFGTGQGRLGQFWKEVLRISEETGREPLLIARQNRKPDIVCTTKRGLEILRWGERKRPLKVLAIFPGWSIRVLLLRDVLMTDFKKLRKMAGLSIAKTMRNKHKRERL